MLIKRFFDTASSVAKTRISLSASAAELCSHHASRLLDSADPTLFDVRSKAPGPQGASRSRPRCSSPGPPATSSAGPRTPAWAGTPPTLGGKEFLILSTHGGIRAADGTPDRARLSHRPLGSRPAHGSRGERAEIAAAPSPSPPTAPTPATAARRAPPACSIPCPTATTRPPSSAA